MRPQASRGALAGFMLVIAVAAALAWTPALEPANRAMLAVQFSALRAGWPRAAARDVVIVGIDDESVAGLPEPISLWHPHFARFLQATALGGAAAVGLDVVFPDRSYDAIVPGYDRQLLLGILAARRTAPLVLTRTIDPTGTPRAVNPLFLSAAGPGAVAFAILPVDDDKFVRRFHERLGARGESVPTLAGTMAARLGAPPAAGLIDFSRGERFAHVPLHEVLAWQAAGDVSSLKRAFAGKPVLLGGVFKFEDQLSAPINLSASDPGNVTMPGVMLHAQALRNLLDGSLIATVPEWAVMLVCFVLASAWWLASTSVRAAVVVSAGAFAVVAGSTALLASGWYAPPAAGLATIVLAGAGRSMQQAVLGMRERAKLRRAFSGYVSPGVMDDILGGQIGAELGGVNRYVCTLFSDIRGYTTRSEGMTPQEIVAFLNSYFERVVEIIHAHHGTVMTFMGDGIMAVFGAPKPLDNPCAHAYAASLELLAYVHDFNARTRSAGVAPIDIGVGLHAGDVVVGHVGSSSRHDYTAIGDVINVASRLEGVTKEVGYRLVYSDAVAATLQNAGGDVPLGPREIKGHTPVEAFGHAPVTENRDGKS